MGLDPTTSDYAHLDMWPPGAIQDWLEPDDAAVLQHKLRVLGRSGVVSILGVLAQRGPQTLAQVVELAQLRPSIAHERLDQLHAIGIIDRHRRRSDQQPAMWDLNHDAMVRLGAYFIRPRVRLSSTAPSVMDLAGRTANEL